MIDNSCEVWNLRDGVDHPLPFETTNSWENLTSANFI